MKLATIPYPDELPRTLDVAEADMDRELRLAAAAKFFEAGRLSSGKAAALAGLDRMTFLAQLQRFQVPALLLDSNEIAAEIRAARELAG